MTIIGNLTRDPEHRVSATGLSVCSFTVAVTRRNRGQNQNNQPETDFFRVTAWRQLADVCAKYLVKGRKVCVIGPVSVHTFTGDDGQVRASMEVTAEDVEFLTSANSGNDAPAATPATPAEQPGGFSKVETDELPF